MSDTEKKELQGIWTEYGKQRLAALTAGGEMLQISYAAVGSGNGDVPLVRPSQTGLIEEVWRGRISNIEVNPDDPTDVIVDVVIPNEIGGFWIREWGLFDDEGGLISVGPHAEQHKPSFDSGQAMEYLERFHLPVTDSGAINITIASQALATKDFVVNELKKHNDSEEAHEVLLGNALDALNEHVNATGDVHEIGLATPQKNGLAPQGGSVGQFYGVKSVLVENEEGELDLVGVYDFLPLPASTSPASEMLPKADGEGKIDVNWLPVVSSMLPATPDGDLPNVTAVKKYVEKYMGNHAPNVNIWKLVSGGWKSPISGTINVILVGGGGRGGNRINNNTAGPGGGGSGQIVSFTVGVVKGETYPITIGASGGTSTAFGRTALPGNPGGTSNGNTNYVAGGSGTSGGGGGAKLGAGTGGASIWHGGYAGEAGIGAANGGKGGAGGRSMSVFDFQVSVAGGGNSDGPAGGGGSTGIISKNGSLISAGNGDGPYSGQGGKGYGAGGGGAGTGVGISGGAGAPGVCILSFYNPELSDT